MDQTTSQWILMTVLGVIIVFFTKKVLNSPSKEDLDKLEKARVDKEKEITLKIEHIEDGLNNKLDKHQDEFKKDYQTFIAEMKAITEDGMKSGTESRKEQWIEIRKLQKGIEKQETILDLIRSGELKIKKEHE